MSTQTESAPTIRNARTKPSTPRKLFVNIPVRDLQRSIDFFESLGFAFNPQFTDATATCMLVGEDAYFMLLTHERFKGFSKRPLGDPARETAALFAVSVGSRDEVDALVKKAVEAGGSYAVDPQDHGFMYGWSFRDPDGHHWEVFWIDPAAVQG
jgi:predicted lactoylglutathione lyase